MEGLPQPSKIGLSLGKGFDMAMRTLGQGLKAGRWPRCPGGHLQETVQALLLLARGLTWGT